MSAHNGTQHSTDEQIDSLYSFWPAPQGTQQACPEAVFSLTLKGSLDGVEAFLTVRGQSASEFQTNLASVRGLLDARPAPQLGPKPATAPEQRFCPVHGTAMCWNEGKDGRKGWFSHKTTEGQWCKGQGR